MAKKVIKWYVERFKTERFRDGLRVASGTLTTKPKEHKNHRAWYGPWDRKSDAEIAMKGASGKPSR